MDNELKTTYILTDGQEVFQRAEMTEAQAAEKNEAARQATDFNIWWQPAGDHPELANVEPVWG